MKQIKLNGVTVRFSGNGRKLGYPTANIKTNTTAKDGVYLGLANLGKFKNHPALIFIGIPKILDNKQRRIEAHLLDIPDNDHYDEQIEIIVKKIIRPNKKFADINELIKAMKQDEQTARSWFKQNEVRI